MSNSTAKVIAIYIRVSTSKQNTRGQEADLKRWVESQPSDVYVIWYRDRVSGKSMERPGWAKLMDDVQSGKVDRIVVWRLDRLGRTASGLTRLFEELQQREVNLISLKDSLDLSTPAGRLMANVLASIAQFETEVRGERIAAGIEAAKARGKRWGGSKPGVRRAATPEKIKAIRQLHTRGTPIAAIARTVGLSRPTIYDVLRS